MTNPPQVEMFDDTPMNEDTNTPPPASVQAQVSADAAGVSFLAGCLDRIIKNESSILPLRLHYNGHEAEFLLQLVSINGVAAPEPKAESVIALH
jgi:hypothetical protein